MGGIRANQDTHVCGCNRKPYNRLRLVRRWDVVSGRYVVNRTELFDSSYGSATNTHVTQRSKDINLSKPHLRHF